MEQAKYVKQGIYVLLLGGEIQYIGMSGSVFSRIAAHEGEFDFDEALFWKIPGSRRNCLDVESDLIKVFQPPMNTQQITAHKAKMPLETRVLEYIKHQEDGWEAEDFDEDNLVFPDGVTVNTKLFWQPLKRPNLNDPKSIIDYVVNSNCLSEIALRFEEVCKNAEVR